MAYRHYETEGLIIGHRNLGEANCLHQVLTGEFGLINVMAQGVRRDRSKLRYHLKNFSFVTLTLVRGREFWRVVGATDPGFFVEAKKEAIVFLKKISLVLQRLIHGEEANQFIYQDLKQAFLLIANQDQLNQENMSNLEIFIMSRLFIQLGYLAPTPELKDLLSLKTFSLSDIEKIKPYRLSLVGQINHALEVAHL